MIGSFESRTRAMAFWRLACAGALLALAGPAARGQSSADRAAYAERLFEASRNPRAVALLGEFLTAPGKPPNRWAWHLDRAGALFREPRIFALSMQSELVRIYGPRAADEWKRRSDEAQALGLSLADLFDAIVVYRSELLLSTQEKYRLLREAVADRDEALMTRLCAGPWLGRNGIPPPQSQPDASHFDPVADPARLREALTALERAMRELMETHADRVSISPLKNVEFLRWYWTLTTLMDAYPQAIEADSDARPLAQRMRAVADSGIEMIQGRAGNNFLAGRLESGEDLTGEVVFFSGEVTRVISTPLDQVPALCNVEYDVKPEGSLGAAEAPGIGGATRHTATLHLPANVDWKLGDKLRIVGLVSEQIGRKLRIIPCAPSGLANQ
jgi:hypothetical protein